MAARTSTWRTVPSARRSKMRSGTGVGTSRACSPSAAPRLRSCGSRPRWGMVDRLQELALFQANADTDALSQALWHACNAGQRRPAEFLLRQGANLNWIPDYAHGTPLDAAQQ